MGGFGSGGRRWGIFRPTAEACYRVDAKMLRKLFDAPQGANARAGTLYTSNRGDQCALMFQYTGGAAAFTLRTQRENADRVQQIAISYTPCRFGGRRVWLHCPGCGRRAFRLYSYLHLVDRAGAPVTFFACRLCARVWYDCQRESDDYHNLKAQAGKIKKRLGGESDYTAPFPDKPRGMRWHTYSRLMEKWHALEMHANETYMYGLARRMPHIFEELGAPPLPEQRRRAR